MRIDMGGGGGYEMHAEGLPAFEPPAADPFAAQDSARARRHQARWDALAGSLLAAAAVAVLVNVFALQNGNRPDFLFGLGLPAGLSERFAQTPAAPPAATQPMPAPASRPPALATPSAPAMPPAPATGAGTLQSVAASSGVPPAAAPRQPQPLVADIQRELIKRGFYSGPADGLTGPRTDAAIRTFEQSTHLKPTGEASEALLAQIRRSAAMVPPANVGAAVDVTGAVRPPAEVPVSPRVLAVQKTLAKLGYGPLKATGRVSAETRQAVQRFEQDRNLPVDGEITDRLVRELSAVSGTVID